MIVEAGVRDRVCAIAPCIAFGAGLQRKCLQPVKGYERIAKARITLPPVTGDISVEDLWPPSWAWRAQWGPSMLPEAPEFRSHRADGGLTAFG